MFRIEVLLFLAGVPDDLKSNPSVRNRVSYEESRFRVWPACMLHSELISALTDPGVTCINERFVSTHVCSPPERCNGAVELIVEGSVRRTATDFSVEDDRVRQQE